MKDGNDDVTLQIDGFDRMGSLRLSNNRGACRTPDFGFRLRIFQMARSTTGQLTLSMRAGQTTRANLPRKLDLTMIGSSNIHHFVLRGTGPLGVIVELRGAWRPL